MSTPDSNERLGNPAYVLALDVFAGLLATRVIVAVVVGLGVALVTTPQAIDSFITLAQEHRWTAWCGLVASTAWLATNAWFWARLALSGHALPGIRNHPWLREALSRGLGVASFLVVANALLRAAASVPPGMVQAMDASNSGVVPLRRAAALLVVAGLAFAALTAPSARRRLGAWQMPPRAVVIISLFIAGLGMGLYGTMPLMAARLLPPGPTILFAAAGLICGGGALTRFGARRQLPLLALLIVGAVGLALLRDRDIIADNHDLRRLAGPARTRPSLATAFGQFLAAEPSNAGSTDVILVAAGGGGLAAADFTATILGDLTDASPRFARHIFAISGVSGGALGATEFVLAQGDRPVGKPSQPCAKRIRHCLQNALAADFLGPALGVLLYSDLLQRFLPFVGFPDRERALEAGWNASWLAAFGDGRMNAPFLDAWTPERPWPALLLNGSSARSGGRLVTSNLELSGTLSADGMDLLTLLEGELTAASAIGTSTRFPYISPLGTIRTGRSAPILDWVADGGYYENLGATTLLDVLDELTRLAAAAKRPVRFTVIQIISDPELSRAHLTAAGPQPLWLPRGIIGPATTLLHSRDARAVYAAETLARHVLSLNGIYVPVRLGQSPTGRTAPLGWSLSPLARDVIDSQWTTACRNKLLAETGFSETPSSTVKKTIDLSTMWAMQGCQVLDPLPAVQSSLSTSVER